MREYVIVKRFHTLVKPLLNMTQTNTDEKQFQDIDMRFGDSQKCMMSRAIQRRKNYHYDAT